MVYRLNSLSLEVPFQHVSFIKHTTSIMILEKPAWIAITDGVIIGLALFTAEKRTSLTDKSRRLRKRKLDEDDFS